LDIGIIILTSLFVITADIHHGKNGGGGLMGGGAIRTKNTQEI
jgi:hypothetical protein